MNINAKDEFNKAKQDQMYLRTAQQQVGKHCIRMHKEELFLI